MSITVTYRRSGIGNKKEQKATLVTLGLRRLNQSVVHEDTPSIRGMIFKVRHLIDVDGAPADKERVHEAI